MGQNTKKKSKSQPWVNRGQQRFDPQSIAFQTSSKHRVKQQLNGSHVRESTSEFETGALGSSDPSKERADPLSFLNAKRRRLT